jgi:predicted nucleic acid-binding protein
MRVLVDTNVLGRLSQPGHPLNIPAQRCLDVLRSHGHELRIVPQVLYEYWAIATRAVEENGLGFSIEQTRDRIQLFKTVFPPLRDERGILEPRESLVVDYAVLGKSTHDARLVASMQRHGLTHLLTFNVPDFQRYRTVAILDPRSLISA